MSNLKDFKNKNTEFTGTKGIDLPEGTTAQRDTGYGSGTLRFNTTTNLMEYYTGTDWKSVDAPPTITGITIDDVGGSSVTSGFIDNEKVANSGLVTIEILGSLFDTTGATVQFIATTGNLETISTQSITRDSANKLTVTVTASDFDLANSPYTVRVTNGSGLSANLEEAITADSTTPTFTNAVDTTYVVTNGNRASGTITAAELIGASGATSYAVTTGSLPTGFTLNSSTGDITWSSVAQVGSDTTTTFTVTATGDDASATRQFKITVSAPVTTTFNSPGTFSVPTGVTAVDVLVVAGGGGAGGFGGGGAGGLIYRPGFPVTPGGTIPVSIGSGGLGGQGGGQPTRSTGGGDTTFSTLTAKGGGGGGQSPLGGPGNYNVGDGQPGGSGGGGGHPDMTSQGAPFGVGGSATQPTQPGDSGTYGFGNAGGQGRNNVPSITGEPGSTAGGGGGAGGAGGPGQGQNPNNGGPGGIGRAYSISGSPVYYAGGGGGAYGGLPGQGGGGNAESPGPGANVGTANRGGGGAMRLSPQAGQPGSGGSGVVIVQY